MARWHVLVNQNAGSSNTPISSVSEALERAGVDADVEAPLTAAEAETAVAEAVRNGVTHLAMVGGDGSVNLAANVVLNMDVEPPILGVLPTGTGCDLLRTFGIPQDLEGAARHLATDTVYPIDVATLEGSWGTRYFVNVAQVGVGAAAAQTASRLTRRLGAARYPLAFAARLPGFPHSSVTVTTERRTYESGALAVIMANAQFFAGGWNIAPKATLVDGVLDMQVIDCAKTRAPSLVPKIIRGNHLADRAVRRFSAARFEIETAVPWPVEADGDYLGNTPVSGRVVSAALRLKI